MREALQRLLPLSRPPAGLDAIIDSIDSEGNPSHTGGKLSDMRALMVIARLLDAQRLVIASGNARFALAPLTRLPEHIHRIECTRADLIPPAQNLAGPAREVVPWSSPTREPTALLVDALDLDRHLGAARAELESGAVTHLVVYNALLSRARRAVLHAQAESGAAAEHIPMADGCTVLRLAPGSGSALAQRLAEVAAEAPWHPARVAATRRGAAGEAAATLLGRFVPSPDDAVLVQRTGRVLADVLREGRESLPGHLAGWGRGVRTEFKRGTDAAAAILEALRCGGPEQRTLRFAGGAWHTAACERAEAVLSGTPKRADLAKLASAMYQFREVLWWMRHWSTEHNAMWTAFAAGRVQPEDLTPLPAKPLQEYLDYYWIKGQGGALQKGFEAIDPSRPRARMAETGNLNHRIRLSQAASLCGFLIGRIAERFPGETIRWLDVGCGNGTIANSADVDEAILDRVEIVGLDFGQSRVSQASRSAARNRRFIAGDGLAPPAELHGTRFHLITAFELLEHLFDPTEVLRLYRALDPVAMAAGSPLDENGGPWTPSKGHVWGFRRTGYEAVFKEAGLDIAMSSEVRVGAYSRGNDWLTVVGTAKGFEL